MIGFATIDEAAFVNMSRVECVARRPSYRGILMSFAIMAKNIGRLMLLKSTFAYAGLLIAIPLNTLGLAQQKRLASEIPVFSEDEELLAKAEQAMINFADARQSLPARNAVIARAQVWAALEQGRRLRMLDYMFLSANDERKSSSSAGEKASSYFAFFIQPVGESNPDTGARRMWDQHLRVGTKTLRRWGLVGKYDSKTTVDEDGLIEGTDKHSTPLLRHVDLFSMPIADHGSFQSGAVSEEFVLLFLRQGKVVRAAKTNSGVVGVWHLSGQFSVVVTVTFDEKSGLMPTSINWRAQDGKDIDKVLENGRIHSMSTTRWKQINFEEAEYWVPVEISVTSPGLLESSSQSELRIFSEWKFGTEALEAIPVADLVDWREPIRRLFNEDFGRSFDEFLELKSAKK